MSEQPLPEDLSAVEAALRGLAPSAGALDRDALLFQAGRASAPRRWPWALAAAASTVTAAVLAVVLATRPPTVIERVREVPAPAAPADVPSSVPPEALHPVATFPHLSLQEKVLQNGLDGLGEAPPSRPSILPTRGDDVP